MKRVAMVLPLIACVVGLVLVTLFGVEAQFREGRRELGRVIVLLDRPEPTRRPGWQQVPREPDPPYPQLAHGYSVECRFGPWQVCVTGFHPQIGTPVIVRGRTTRHYEICVPYVVLLAIFASLPLWHLHRWGRRRRCKRPVGLCAHCGYDLRATPDVCPECGRRSREPAS